MKRLAAELAALGGNTAANRTTIVGNSTDAWGSTSQEYAGAYAAVRYMHDQIKLAGGNGIEDIFNYLEADPVNRTLDQALTSASSGAFASLADFQTKWSTDGESYIGSMDLANTDTGAVGGFYADGGAIRTSTSVVPDTAQSVQYFNMIYPTVESGESLSFHVGSNSTQNVDFDLTDMSSKALGIQGVDLVNNASEAIGKFDTAIVTAASERAHMGAFQNRLEHTTQVAAISQENLTASESRIRDTNMAKEMTTFTKFNILNQAAQANQVPQAVLQLLQ